MTNAGSLIFNQSLPYVAELEGDIDGVTFSIRGKGVGNATNGKLEAKFICTTGELPVPWASVISSLGYGSHCFSKYPNDIKDFFKSAFPQGYVQERTIAYDNDGALTTRAEITFENGAIYNRVKVTGTGFDKNGIVLGKKLEFKSLPSCIYVLPDDNGVKSKYQKVYKIIGGGYQHSTTTQKNYPIDDGLYHVPEYHHLQVSSEISKDPKEKRDHAILHESSTAVDCFNY